MRLCMDKNYVTIWHGSCVMITHKTTDSIKHNNTLLYCTTVLLDVQHTVQTSLFLVFRRIKPFRLSSVAEFMTTLGSFTLIKYMTETAWRCAVCFVRGRDTCVCVFIQRELFVLSLCWSTSVKCGFRPTTLTLHAMHTWYRNVQIWNSGGFTWLISSAIYSTCFGSKATWYCRF